MAKATGRAKTDKTRNDSETAAAPKAKRSASAKKAADKDVATSEPKPARKTAPKAVAKATPETVADKTTKPRARKAAASSGTDAKAAAKTKDKPASKDTKAAARKPAADAAASGVAALKAAVAEEATKPAAVAEKKEKAAAKETDREPAPRKAAKAGDKIWLKSYPINMPADIEPLRHQSIGDLLVGACKRYAGRPAFSCMGKTISFCELERISFSVSAWLQSRGLKKGARVALMMPNILQYPVAMMAVLRAGYTVVNVNPLYTPRELQHQLNDSGAEAIFILENFATTLQAILPKTKVKHVVVASMGDMLGVKGLLVNLVVRRVKKMVPAWSLPGHLKFKDVVKAGSAMTLKPVSVSPEDYAFLQYTGGTTGVSKGAILTHANVLSNVEQLALWVEDAYTVKPKPAHLTFVCALPLYHIFALTVNALMGMQQGALNVLIPNPRDIPGFVKELSKQPFHIFPGLNTLFNALLNNEAFRKLDFKPLILSLGGGMAVQKGVAERWQQVTGNNITEGYGLSETSPVATANKCGARSFTGTIGLPIPSTEIAIRDEKGNDLPVGEVGEICIRGPQVMAGYWNRPEETEKVMTADGFFKSGDMGFMDEAGYTKIVDRKKDMILVSGFNVYPNELEEVVAQHPGVLEVAAVGVVDEHSGEVPKLFIVRKDQNLTSEDLMVYCRENLTGYKRPKYIEFRNELPKTNVGKILRRELRDNSHDQKS